MFIVLLRFSSNKGQASQFMEGHKDWIKRGFDAGVFLLAGNLQPNLGGAIVAYNTSRAELQSRLDTDPFVAENVVNPGMQIHFRPPWRVAQPERVAEGRSLGQSKDWAKSYEPQMNTDKHR